MSGLGLDRQSLKAILEDAYRYRHSELSELAFDEISEGIMRVMEQNNTRIEQQLEVAGVDLNLLSAED